MKWIDEIPEGCRHTRYQLYRNTKTIMQWNSEEFDAYIRKQMIHKRIHEGRLALMDKADELVANEIIHGNDGRKHIWITISAKTGMKPEVFEARCILFANRKFMRKCKWVIEFFSEQSPEGGNLHVHMLTEGYCKPSQLVKWASEHFGVPSNLIDHDYKSAFKYQARMDYLLGQKSEIKNDYVIKDRLWRDDMGFQHLYQ